MKVVCLFVPYLYCALSTESHSRTSYTRSMATFTPDTYKGRIRTEGPGRGLWEKMNWRDVGYNVIITGGVANASPGAVGSDADTIAAADAGSGEGGKAWFRGGITYTITGTEDTILQAAGYTTA